MSERFPHPIKSRMKAIGPNLYLNPADPAYYEKILRYADPASAEAHYHLGKKYAAEGVRHRAAVHFRRAMEGRDPDYALRARQALGRLEREGPQAGGSGGTLPPNRGTSPSQGADRWLTAAHWLLAVLLVLNLLVLLACLLAGPGSREGVPALQQAAASGWQQPGPQQGAAAGRQAPGPGQPGLDQLRTNSGSGQAQSQPTATNDHQADLQDEIAVNLVRTALSAYRQDHGALPEKIQALFGDYPGNYLSYLPLEGYSASNAVVSGYDGSGGWVYRPGGANAPNSAADNPDVSGKQASPEGSANGTAFPSMPTPSVKRPPANLSTVFYPNTPQGAAAALPYHPVEVFVGKGSHELAVVEGANLLADFPVGLGRHGATPSGTFTVQNRVLAPQGLHPGVFGAAALGLGRYALHGTNQDASIGANLTLGCIRLHNPDILELFPLVPRGAKVAIADAVPARYTRSRPVAPHLLDALLPVVRPAIRQTAPGTTFHWMG